METYYSFPFVHKHKLSKNGKLNYPCCVCSKIDPEESCYVCITTEEACKNFCFCRECANYTKEEEMLKLHPHIL